MNNLEQILKKRIVRKDEQIKYLLSTLSVMGTEIEVMESLACAFAFDLALEDPRKSHMAEERWSEAVRAALGEEK